jgi:hypothetical protein
MERQGIYLYGFTRPGSLGVGPVAGVEDTVAVALLEVCGLAAVLGTVDLDDFQGEGAEKNLQDPSWIIPRACQHERVVEVVLASAPVMPVRFGAVFSSREALADFVACHGETIAGFLDDVADKEEWAVKGLLDEERATTSLLGADPALAEQWRQLPASPGARYFREKQLRARARQQIESWGRVLAGRVAEELSGLAVEVRPLRLRGADAGVLHSALLLPRERVSAFRARVRDLAETFEPQGLILECTGAWPPYSFCPALGEVVP